jgi:hypothetical protein
MSRRLAPSTAIVRHILAITALSYGLAAKTQTKPDGITHKYKNKDQGTKKISLAEVIEFKLTD